MCNFVEQDLLQSSVCERNMYFLKPKYCRVRKMLKISQPDKGVSMHCNENFLWARQQLHNYTKKKQQKHNEFV